MKIHFGHICQENIQKFMWLYAIVFSALFIFIANQNIAIQKVPNFHYKVLPTGQWQITDNTHPTMTENTVITALIIDQKKYPLTKDWLRESFYQIRVWKQQQQIIANEELLYNASSITLIDALGQAHAIKLTNFNIFDTSGYTCVLYIFGWLMFTVGFFTASVGSLNGTKLLFLFASFMTALVCFYSVGSINRVWAINPTILYHRLVFANLGIRLYLISWFVLVLCVPINLLQHSLTLKIISVSLLIIQLSTWGIFYFFDFFALQPQYHIQHSLPLFMVVFGAYFALYIQWRSVHKKPIALKQFQTNGNVDFTLYSNANNRCNHFSSLEFPATQGGYKLSQRLALRWMLVLILITGLTNALFSLLFIQLKIIDGDYTLVMSVIHFLFIYVGISVLILHKYLYKVEHWWWQIWGIFFAFSICAANVILLGSRIQKVTIFGVLDTVIIGLLAYFATAYYFQNKYTKAESNLLAVAIPKLMSINVNDLTVSEINNKWQGILSGVFQPKYIELISNKAFFSVFDNHQSKMNDAESSDIALISNAGETLVIQAVDDKVFVLHHSSDGLKLFNPDNLKKAQLLWSMVKQAHGSTLAYCNGEVAERKRIAYDLHDDIGGKLLYLTSQKGEYGNYARQTLQDLRTLTHALSNETQTLALIIADVRYKIRKYCDNANIELIFNSEINEETLNKLISAQAAVNILCILNELSRNAVQNPSTTTLLITLNITSTSFSLCVENDGEITHPNEWKNGLGTISTERRVNQLSGDIIWGSKDGGGVTCKVKLPTSQLYRKAF